MSSKEEETKEVEKLNRPKILRSHSDRDDSFGGWLEKPRKGYFWSDWARKKYFFTRVYRRISYKSSFSKTGRWFIICPKRAELRYFEVKTMCPPEEILVKPTRRVRSLCGAQIEKGESKAGNFGFVLTFPDQEPLKLRANTADEQVEWIERLKYSIAEANKNKDGTTGSWNVSHVVSQWSDSDWEDEDSEDKSGPFSPILQRNRTKENPDDRLRLKGERIVRFSRFLTMNENATKPFEVLWEKILWGIDILHHVVNLETITTRERKHPGIDKRLHAALHSLCKYLIDRGNETRVRVELEKMFQMYLKVEKDCDDKSTGQYRGNMRRVLKILNTWEKYKILQEFVRRAFNSIDKNLANLSRDGDAKSVSALAIRVYMKTMVSEDKALSEICEPIFETLDKFRQNSSSLDVMSSRVIRNTCELFLILGITEDKNFDRIESFVDVLRANNGQFVVKSEFSLIPDPTSLDTYVVFDLEFLSDFYLSCYLHHKEYIRNNTCTLQIQDTEKR